MSTLSELKEKYSGIIDVHIALETEYFPSFDKDGYYGRIFVTVDAVTDECEWWLNLPLLAERFGLDETDIKTIEVKYEQIGDRWLETAGASSGAMAGVMLSLSAVGAVYVLRRKKDDRGQCTL